MKSPRPARASSSPAGQSPRQEVRRHQHTDYGKAPGIGDEDGLREQVGNFRSFNYGEVL